MGKLKGQKKQNRGKGIKWQIEKKVDLKEQCLWLGVRKYWDYIYPLDLVWNLNLLNENRRNPLEIKYKTYKWHQSKVAGNHFEAVTLNWMRQKTSYSFSSEIQHGSEKICFIKHYKALIALVQMTGPHVARHQREMCLQKKASKWQLSVHWPCACAGGGEGVVMHNPSDYSLSSMKEQKLCSDHVSGWRSNKGIGSLTYTNRRGSICEK